MQVVVDNTVLSNFGLVGALDILRTGCRGEAFTTRFVIDEFRAGQQIGKLPAANMEWLRLIELTDEEQRLFHRLRNRLGAGEASCLAVAIQRHLPLLTDDLLARKMAMHEGVRLSGTIGILVSLVEASAIPLSEANRLLAEMIEAGYFAPFAKLDALVNVK